jgi:hypothetical protein
MQVGVCELWHRLRPHKPVVSPARSLDFDVHGFSPDTHAAHITRSTKSSFSRGRAIRFIYRLPPHPAPNNVSATVILITRGPNDRFHYTDPEPRYQLDLPKNLIDRVADICRTIGGAVTIVNDDSFD